MKVYIQSYENGVPHNYNFANAMSGFREMGFEIVPFHTPEQLDKSDPQNVVVGYVGTVRYKLRQLGIPVEELDYPEELREFLGRKVWSSTMNTIAHSPELWPVFVKSQEDKRFTGNVIRKVKDLIGGGTENADSLVWCSELVEFVAEYRCFIRYGQILDVRRYKGDWSVAPNRCYESLYIARKRREVLPRFSTCRQIVFPAAALFHQFILPRIFAKTARSSSRTGSFSLYINSMYRFPYQSDLVSILYSPRTNLSISTAS